MRHILILISILLLSSLVSNPPLFLHKSDNTPLTSHFLVKSSKLWYMYGSPKPLIGNQVRHILILLSILLLSSPVIGQSKKSGLLYIWKNGSRYVGEWKDGKKHGQGTYTSGKGEGEGDKYVGEFKGGFKNGH